MRKAMVGLAAAIAAMSALVIGTGIVDAQGARTYTWYAELTSVDRTSKTITTKAQIRDGVSGYVGSYKPGDKLMLVWVPVKGESDTVIYAPKYEVMKGIDDGYILPVEFVSADPANRSLTFRTPVPDNALQSVAALQPGTWIKVTTPMQQPREMAALTAAVPSEKPNLKPPPPPPPVEGGRGRGRGGAAGSGAPDVSGTWTISASLGANAIKNDCTFKQDGAKITGSCPGPSGPSELTGDVAGNQISFGYSLNYGGMDIDFVYAGTLDTAGTGIKGTVNVVTVSADFSASKK